MSYEESISVVEGDYGYDLEFKVYDAEDNVVDLTGATISIKIYEPGASSSKVSSTAEIVNASQGECKYTVQQGDFDEAGKVYHVELELDYGNKVVTAKGVTITVVSEAP